MKVKLLFSCNHFKCANDFVIEPILFTDDKSILQSEFSDKQFVYKVGVSTVKTAFEHTSLGYYIFNYDINESDGYDDTELIKMLHSYSYRVQYWLRFMWFAKDSSVCINKAFVDIPEKNGCMIFNDFDKFSDSAGRLKIETFTKEHLLFVAEMVKRYSEYMEGTSTYSLDEYELSRGDNEMGGVIQAKTKIYPYNNNRRIERAWIFLNFARRTEFLPMKIALYIPVFESLFSTGNISARNLSNRITNYLGLEEVRSSAYDAHIFRHIYIHGSELVDYSTTEEQIKLSTSIDEVARKVLTKIFLHDLDKYKQRETDIRNWFEILDRMN